MRRIDVMEIATEDTNTMRIEKYTIETDHITEDDCLWFLVEDQDDQLQFTFFRDHALIQGVGIEFMISASRQKMIELHEVLGRALTDSAGFAP